jgi:hypothetical protein
LQPGLPQARLVASAEHQKAVSPRTDQFPAEGAVRHGVTIPRVDAITARGGGSTALALPMHTRQMADFVEVAVLQRDERLLAEIAG